MKIQQLCGLEERLEFGRQSSLGVRDLPFCISVHIYLDVAELQASERSQSICTQQRLVRVWPLNLPSVSVMLHPVLPTAELFVILIPFGVLLNFPVSGEK